MVFQYYWYIDVIGDGEIVVCVCFWIIEVQDLVVVYYEGGIEWVFVVIYMWLYVCFGYGDQGVRLEFQLWFEQVVFQCGGGGVVVDQQVGVVQGVLVQCF